MARLRVPVSYKGGRKKWVEDLEKSIQVQTQYLTKVAEPDKPSTPMRTEAVFESWYALGLYGHWQGEEEVARAYWARAASLAHAYLEREMPALTSERAPNYAWLARTAALASALSGQESLACIFFSHAERFSTGLVTGQEPRSADPGAVLDDMGLQPLQRVYSLIRLGRMSGFHGLIFPEPNSDEAIWVQTDIHGLIGTAEHCLAIGRRKRLEVFASERGLPPLLRALVAALEGHGSQEAAREALAAYERSIRNMADFRRIYPVVLDLKAAFPALFNA
ncbi:MAG TPA: hypothetical protein VFZ09_31020 [Archangium sp.]|uniref:hypothetical protein n=1 Tax=Archangium sp. TaxID=1872627 RepID=UPI002E36F18F|nr:hypothetical protein [Archangium sp.]HEX5750700.1 hypothetical protein [Archangium sp.]